MAEYFYYWNKLKYYGMIILPLAVVGIIFFYIARSVSETFLDFMIIFVRENLKVILFLTLLLAVLIALLLTQATKIMMTEMRRNRQRMREKSKVRRMRLGVMRE